MRVLCKGRGVCSIEAECKIEECPHDRQLVRSEAIRKIDRLVEEQGDKKGEGIRRETETERERERAGESCLQSTQTECARPGVGIIHLDFNDPWLDDSVLGLLFAQGLHQGAFCFWIHVDESRAARPAQRRILGSTTMSAITSISRCLAHGT